MKKILTGALAIGAASAMMMTAFAGELTVDQVFENYAAAGASVSVLTSEATALADVSISVPDADLDMAIEGSMLLDIEADLSNMSVATSGSMSAAFAGQEVSADMEMYMVPEDDTLAVYASVAPAGEDAQVVKSVITAEQTQQIMDMIANAGAMSGMTDLPITFELDEETGTIADKECYILRSTITAEDLPAILASTLETVNQMNPEAASALPSEEDLSMVSMFAAGLQINIEIDVDTETFLPLYACIDMDGSDFTTLATLFASFQGLTKEDGSLMEVDINAEDLFLMYTYDYPESVEIVVPEEIIESAEEVDASALTEAGLSEIAG